VAVSAYGIINRIMMFALMPGMVIGQGLQPILGYNYGAKRYGRALKAIMIAAVYATSLNIIAFIFLYFMPEVFIGIFTTDGELLAAGSIAARRVWLVLYLFGPMFVGSLVFQALGKAVQSFVTSLARPALFLIPSILILPRFLELDGVWLAFPVTDVLTFILTMALLIPQIMQLRREHRRIEIEKSITASGESGLMKSESYPASGKLSRQPYAD
jgi:Na+-driven multidrug efflux pump